MLSILTKRVPAEATATVWVPRASIETKAALELFERKHNGIFVSALIYNDADTAIVEYIPNQEGAALQ